ncbi:MAG: hypothetical protein OEZ57_03405 [Nitrospirota bacterium]|nr:hypothetical protein [Nitrospirota bacterium]MDH5773947.1 hypothetical protein [Nitrospirota bacterium]
MRKLGALGLVTVLVALPGCASYTDNQVDQSQENRNDEQVDLYLSTLDDKHFVWCELDLGQCREDFEKWRRTPRGRALIREFDKEGMEQTHHTHQVPNVFRTRFVDEPQLTEQAGQEPETMAKPSHSINQPEILLQERIPIAPMRYGPEIPTSLKAQPSAHKSP